MQNVVRQSLLILAVGSLWGLLSLSAQVVTNMPPLPPRVPPPTPPPRVMNQPARVTPVPVPTPPPVVTQPPSLTPPPPSPAIMRPPPVMPTNAMVPTYQAPQLQTPSPLVWDAMAKEARAKPGDTNVSVTFYCTNTATSEVAINSTHSSCGCTVAQLPSYPYRIPGSGKGQLTVLMDIRGKYGTVVKDITVMTSHGVQKLSVTARIPDPVALAVRMSPEQRLLNQNISKADRQAVFKGDCARCHAEPGMGKMGKDLFVSVCGVCHEPEHRASMVPDLRYPKRPAQRDYWVQWILFGKSNSLMPAFSRANGGALTDAQIFSVVEYLVGPFQQEPPRTPPAPQAMVPPAQMPITGPLPLTPSSTVIRPPALPSVPPPAPPPVVAPQ